MELLKTVKLLTAQSITTLEATPVYTAWMNLDITLRGKVFRPIDIEYILTWSGVVGGGNISGVSLWTADFDQTPAEAYAASRVAYGKVIGATGGYNTNNLVILSGATPAAGKNEVLSRNIGDTTAKLYTLNPNGLAFRLTNTGVAYTGGAVDLIANLWG